MTLICPCGGKFVLLPKKFGKRGGVFRILMPTAPTRIKLFPALPGIGSVSFTGRAFLSDVFALPVRLRPPKMGIVVVIGVFCRDWEGGFVSGGRKRRVLLQSGG